ncbi:hypothetical protein IJJ18_01020 [Candidatus Saccharibacteria bacterium]|nr:hypothetical protein [Candidatus Saccharibacteria bacterium]
MPVTRKTFKKVPFDFLTNVARKIGLSDKFYYLRGTGNPAVILTATCFDAMP